jgi:hypothetical protein
MDNNGRPIPHERMPTNYTFSLVATSIQDDHCLPCEGSSLGIERVQLRPDHRSAVVYG